MGIRAEVELLSAVGEQTGTAQRWSKKFLGSDYKSLPENHPLRRLALAVITFARHNLRNDVHDDLGYDSWEDYAGNDDNVDLLLDSHTYVGQLPASERAVLIGQLAKVDSVAYSTFNAEMDITDELTNKDAIYYVAQSMTRVVLLAFYEIVVVPLEHEGLLSEEEDDDE